MPVGLVQRLREVAGDGHAVQIVPCMAYLSDLLLCNGSEQPKDIILVYKANSNLDTSTLPIDVRDADDSIDSNVELGGNPLPAPFNESVLDHSVMEEQCRWPNYHPLRMSDAYLVLNEIGDIPLDQCKNELDVWCLVDEGIQKNLPSLNGSQLAGSLSMLDADTSSSVLGIKVNKSSRILLGLQLSNSWWTRSFVEAQAMCSLNEIDPNKMKKGHLEMSNIPEYQMDIVVQCRYNIKGQRISTGGNTSSVTLELKWKQPAVHPPEYQEAKVLVQATVGDKSSPAHDLWRQLCVLNNLFDLLFSCWREKTIPDMLPHAILSSEEPCPPLESRLKTLIFGGKQALEAQNVNRRMSLAPVALSRQSMAPGFLGRKSIIQQQPFKETNEMERNSVSLTEALLCATTGTRESDVTDGLFSLLIECKTYKQLRSAFDVVFMELREAHRSYVHPKNNSRMAKIINSFMSGNLDNLPDFLEMEGSLYPLELLIELGLEKLTTDYCYVFLDSQLAGRNELQTPELVRSGLGTLKDKWLANCGQILGWLAQVHTALELLLPLEDSLSSNCVPYMATKALKFYQSETSPVRSVSCLLLPGNALQELSLPVKSDIVRAHTQKSFDWWRMTLESKSERKHVKHVFLRSHLKPIFPSQLYQNEENLLPVEGAEKKRYHCASMVTISQQI